MKRIISFVISLVMLAAMLSACAEKHSHKNDLWTATLDGHYQICRSSAKKINEGKHTLDNSNACTECGATLHANSPSLLEFTVYNKYGLIDYYVEYLMGKETLRHVYEYVYENGKPISYKVNEGTEIYEEGIVVEKNGEYECLRTKRNYSDYYEVRTYDEDGFYTTITDYDKNGNVLGEEKYTYEKDSKGKVLNRTCYENGNKVKLEKFAYDKNGVPYVCENMDYNADGTVKYVIKYRPDGYMQEYAEYENGEIEYFEKYEYVFDEKGELLSRKTFKDDVLLNEYNYKYADYEYAYPKTVLSESSYYTPYGEKHIEVYDDFGDVVLSKTVDSDGETISEYKIEHTRDELDRVILVKEYDGDRLSSETAYEYDGDSDDWSKRAETYYYNDGGKAVTVYNDDYERISYIEYDADGEVVKSETYEREYNENGNLISEKTYSDGALIGEDRFSYDENGNITLVATYENGVLIETREYLYGQSDGDSSIYTEYYSDGGKRVIYYLENGNISLDVQYDADGNYVHYLRYTTVKNDDGTETTYTYDENDKLISESREDENRNTLEWIEYYSDGKIVHTYNEDGTVTREEFDNDGNLISSETY